MWTLVENLTMGISIPAEEPYLTNLIEYLVASVKETKLPEEIKSIQASVLTNLCFKNEIAIVCLLRFTKSKDLLNYIQEIPVLWCKLAIGMARFDHTMVDLELLTILKYVFEYKHFFGLIQSKDHRLLYHILELLDVCFERDEHSRKIVQQFDVQKTFNGVLTVCQRQTICLCFEANKFVNFSTVDR